MPAARVMHPSANALICQTGCTVRACPLPMPAAAPSKAPPAPRPPETGLLPTPQSVRCFYADRYSRITPARG